MNVELSAERFAELNLRVGDMVYVSPRRVRVFATGAADVPEYVI